jgi:hypothetical protein
MKRFTAVLIASLLLSVASAPAAAAPGDAVQYEEEAPSDAPDWMPDDRDVQITTDEPEDDLFFHDVAGDDAWAWNEDGITVTTDTDQDKAFDWVASE